MTGTARLSLVIGTLLAVSSPVAFAQAFKAPIAKVTVTGLKKVPEPAVDEVLGLRAGQTFDAAKVRAAVAKLNATGLFSDINYQWSSNNRGIVIQIDVDEMSGLLRARMENYVWNDEDALWAAVKKQVPLFTGWLPSSGSLTSEVDAAIQDYLESKGLSQPLVQAMPGTKALSFTIIRPRLILAGINFEGSGEMQPELQQAAQYMMGLPYTTATMHGYLKTWFRNIYGRRGYLQAAAGQPVFQLTPYQDYEHVTVTFPVVPGKQYTWGQLSWTGDVFLSAAQLNALVHLKQGAMANLDVLNAQLNDAHAPFLKAGYLYPKLVPHFTAGSGDAINVQVQVVPGVRYRMGDLRVAGFRSKDMTKAQQNWPFHGGTFLNIVLLKDYMANFPDLRAVLQPSIQSGLVSVKLVAAGSY